MKKEMKKRYNIIVFIFSGLYGHYGEIGINIGSNWLRGQNLWTYYDGGSTTWEAFILFGFAGVLAFNIYRFLYKRKDKIYDSFIRQKSKLHFLYKGI